MPRRVPRVKAGEKITVEWANKIADAINTLLNLSVSGPLSLTISGSGVSIAAIIPGAGVGKLKEDMSRGGNADVDVWSPGATGGLGSDLGFDLNIVDSINLIQSGASPLESPARVAWIPIGGHNVLIGYDCDEV